MKTNKELKLKELVSQRLKSRGLDQNMSWEVAAIKVSEEDSFFSAWLSNAINEIKVLKRRNKFKLLNTTQKMIE